MKTRCFGYGRASTNRQEVTEQVQRLAVEEYYRTTLRAEGVEWAGWFYDAATSGDTAFSERPEGLKVWVLAQPGDFVVASKNDRLFRNTLDALRVTEAFDQKGVVLQPLDLPRRKSAGRRSADDEFVTTLQYALGRRERRITGERTSAAMRRLSANGVPLGRAKHSSPIGWMRHANGLTEDHEERARVEQMAQWRDHEGLSFDRLALRVNCQPYCWRRRYAVGKNGRASSGWDRRSIRLALEARAKGYPKVFLNSRRRTHASSRTPA
jgi:DNA invertase Pin-like site-specific DNA recombinase